MLWSIALLGSPLGALAQPSAVEGLRLLQESERIFIGRVISNYSQWVDGGRNIATVYRFRVTRWIRGSGGEDAEVVEYGGQLGPLRLTVSHTAHYREGADYLVFSKPDSSGHWRTVGGPDGALPVIADDSGEGILRLHHAHPLRQLLETSSPFLPLNAVEARLKRFLEQGE